MKSYASGAELCAEIKKRGDLFIAEFSDVPANSWDEIRENIDRSPRQMIAYQLGWMDLLLSWEEDEKKRHPVVTPAPGFKWNALGGLYESFYAQWFQQSSEQLIAAFIARVDRICTWIESLSEAELFGTDQRSWASSTPSAWPVWKWVHINTVAPFTTFRTKIRKWKRADQSAL